MIPGLDAAKLAIAPYLLAIKIGLVVLLLVAAAVLYWRIGVWREGWQSLEATEKALATRTAELSQCTASAEAAALAYQEAAGKAESVAIADRATAERIERELQTRLAAADGAGRDLARRLRDYQARRCSGAVSAAPGATAGPPGSGGEPAEGEAVDRATAEYLTACHRDAERLDGWIQWWREVELTRR